MRRLTIFAIHYLFHRKRARAKKNNIQTATMANGIGNPSVRRTRRHKKTQNQDTQKSKLIRINGKVRIYFVRIYLFHLVLANSGNCNFVWSHNCQCFSILGFSLSVVVVVVVAFGCFYFFVSVIFSHQPVAMMAHKGIKCKCIQFLLPTHPSLPDFWRTHRSSISEISIAAASTSPSSPSSKFNEKQTNTPVQICHSVFKVFWVCFYVLIRFGCVYGKDIGAHWMACSQLAPHSYLDKII